MKSKYYYTLFVLVLSLGFTTSIVAQDARDQSISTTAAPVESTIKLKITGINCGGDIKDIQKQIAELKGVTSCVPARKPSATTIFEVKFNPALVTEKEIRSAVEGTAGCSDPESRPYKVKS